MSAAVQQMLAAIPPATLAGTRDTLTDPVKFARRWLLADLWPKQVDVLQSVFTNRRTAVRACHSSGKTYTAAVATLAFLARHREAVVVTSAPTFSQVTKLIWSEIRSLVKRSKYPWPAMPPAAPELRIDEKRYAFGISTRVEGEDEGVRIQGLHSKNILVILDEAPGVDAHITAAAEGMMASGNASMLMIGNPTISSGPFFDAFNKNRSQWACFKISAFDCPNLAGLSIEQLLEMPEEQLRNNPRPYLISKLWVLEQYKKFGKDHPFYTSRVEGDFPTQDEYSLISLAQIERAEKNELQAQPGTKVSGGADCAGPGKCASALVLRRGPRVILDEETTMPDPRGWFATKLEPFMREKDLENVNIDSIGIGYGYYLHLKDLGFPMTPVNVGDAPISKDAAKYSNLKSELYWGLRMHFEQGTVAGLTDETTQGQLLALRFETTPQGKIQMESKDSMERRGVPSPDRAEALMLAYAQVQGDTSVWARL